MFALSVLTSLGHLSQRERQVLRSTHYTERCIEVRPYSFDRIKFGNSVSKLQQAVLIVLKIWTPCDFPIISVQVSKIRMISTPEDFLWFFDNGSACIFYEFNYFVDFLLTVNIICQSNTTETISNLRRIVRVNIFCQ